MNSINKQPPNHESARLTDQQRLRLRQAIEIAVFSAIALVFFHYGPFWVTDNAINLSITIGFTFILFVCYLSLRHQITTTSATGGEPNIDGADEESPADLASPTPFDQRTYHVPRTFGIAAIIVLTLLIALLTVGLQSMDAPPIVVIATIGFVAIVCFMQALMERGPRVASCLAGILFGFLVIPQAPWLLEIVQLVLRLPNGMGRPAEMVLGAIVGAGLGYLGGTLAAGIVLAGDLIMEWWHGNQLQFSR